jgi:DNA-binding NarL/FixJ family response regulator
VLITLDDGDYVHEALECHVVGYLLKDRPVNELIHPIHVAKESTLLMASAVAAKLVRQIRQLKSTGYRHSPAGDVPGRVRDLGVPERCLPLLHTMP